MILENLKHAYLFKAIYCSKQNNQFCINNLIEEFIETVNSKEFSSFNKNLKEETINAFKQQVSSNNLVLEYKKAS